MSGRLRIREHPTSPPGSASASRQRRGDPARADRSQPRYVTSGVRRSTTAAPERLTADDEMTAPEVAGLLHAPISTVEDWARRGILPSVKIGRRRLYIRQQIEAVLLGGGSIGR